MTAVLGGPETVLDDDAVTAFVEQQLGGIDLDGRSVCVVIPDGTRRCPLPLLLGAVQRAVVGRVRSCKALVALGTHAAMSGSELRALVGGLDIEVMNHEWWDEATFTTVGVLDRDRIAELSGGRLDATVPIRLNRHVVESDVTLIVGPVLPHEVVGFSGGHKYLFPGLSGPELIDLTHWLGALITSHDIIGTLGITPVRALVEAAAELVPGERQAFCVVTDRFGPGLRFVSFDEPRAAWSAAAGVASRTHIEHLDAPVERVVSIVAPRYADLWTGAKGFYKVEPVVADGGEVIIYAPHIADVSVMHPALLDIGYHCRDYFVANWDQLRHHRWGELAHSTHLFGAGTYDPERGEQARVQVTLATSIPPDVVRRVNLTPLDPDDVDLAALAADDATIVVPDAGEVLFRLR